MTAVKCELLSGTVCQWLVIAHRSVRHGLLCT